MAMIRSKAAASAIVGIYYLLLFVFIMGCLYYGQSLLIPLTLAALFAFLLSPLVTRIERWLGRVFSIMLVVLSFLFITGMISYVLTNQLIEFSNKLPTYRGNIESKLNYFHLREDNGFIQVLDTVAKWKNHLPNPVNPDLQNAGGKEVNAPTPVKVVESSSLDLTMLIKIFISSTVNILESTGLIFILVIFMLFNREDLRGRVIRLIGPRRISSTTRAIDDASQRISQFLFMKLLINLAYGFIIAIGLYFIGIPNAILWGGLAALLRFIPYLGAWISALIPCILSLAISPNWITPLLTIGLFGALDIVVANVIEPLFFSAGTGISSLALIVSAVFWTLLWGPVGLLLSIPLTVCIVVLGRHIPNLVFLSVLLGDEEAFALYEECYQRLLAVELSEAMLLITNYLKTNSVTNLFDSIFIPILSSAETDRRQDFIEEEQLSYFNQNIKDILEDLNNLPLEFQAVSEKLAEEKQAAIDLPPYKVLCLPTQAERDELASIMLARLLTVASFEVDIFSSKSSMEELLKYVEQGGYDAICISLVAPASLMQARNIFTQLHRHFPELKIILGLWGHAAVNPEMEQRLGALGVSAVVLLLSQAVLQLEKLRLMKPKLK